MGPDENAIADPDAAIDRSEVLDFAGGPDRDIDVDVDVFSDGASAADRSSFPNLCPVPDGGSIPD